MTMSKIRRRFRPGFDFWSGTTLVLVIFYFVFLVYPIGSLIIRSFQKTGQTGFSLENYFDFFTHEYYYKPLFNSLFVGITTTLTSTVIGLVLAYLMTRYNIWAKRVLKFLFIVALMEPPFIGAYSWIILFGRSGVITKLFSYIGITLPTIYGKLGIILVLSLSQSCYVFLYVSAALTNIDSSLEEAAENLGSNKLKRIITITFPVIIPTITSAMIIVFMRSLADFGTPLLIGEGYTTLPVLVYNAYLSEMGGDAHMASALSMVLILLCTIILIIQKLYISKKNYIMTSLRPPHEVVLHGWKRFLVTFPCFLWVIIALLPQFTVIVASFIKTNGPIFVGGFTFNNYKQVMGSMLTNIRNSFSFSTVAIVLIVIVGTATAYISVRRRKQGGELLDLAVMFPYIIPGAVLGICFIVAFNKPPLMIAGTALILIVSYMVRKLPYTVRSSSGILEQIDKSVDEASINLGVSPMKTFLKITARLMAPGVIAGAIISWVQCLNELSSTLLLYSSRTATMSVAIYTQVSRGNYGTASALGMIMTASISLALGVFFIVSKGKGSAI